MNSIETRITNFQQFIYQNRWILVMVAVLALIAYGFNAFDFLLLTDDWQLFQEQGGQYDLFVQHGRWVHRIVVELFGHNYPAPAFTLSLLLISVVASAGLQIKTISLKHRYSWFVFIAVFMLFPFWVETMPFGSIHMRDAVAVFAAGAYGFTAYVTYVEATQNKNYRMAILYFGLSAVLFSLSASSYQPYIFMGAIAYILGMINSYLTESATIHDVMFRLMILGGVVIVGTILYVVEFNLSLAFFGVSPLADTDPRSVTGPFVSSLEELQITIQRAGRYIEQFLFRAQHLFPVIAKYIFMLFLLIFAGYVFVWKIRDKKYNWGTLALIFASLALVFIMPWLLGIIRLPALYRYPAIIANASVYAGIMALTLDKARLTLLRLALIGLSIILILIFLFQQNSASLILHALNTRDMAITNRITDRIESHPNYSLLEEKGDVYLIVIGRPDVIVDRPFTAIPTGGLMNTSVIQRGIFDSGPIWLGYAINRVQSGSVNFITRPWWRLNDTQKSALSDVIRDMQEWPHPDSIMITDDGQVVILFEHPQ